MASPQTLTQKQKLEISKASDSEQYGIYFRFTRSSYNHEQLTIA
jgi:hypothetical protein